MISVGAYDEGPGQVLTRSHLDSGRFGIYAVRRPTLIRLLRLFAAILVGRWRQMPDLVATDAVEVTVTCGRPRLRAMNDGEVKLLDTPLRYSIRPPPLRVLRAPPVAGADDAQFASPDASAEGAPAWPGPAICHTMAQRRGE